MALRFNVGQYYSAVSPVHAMDARVKLVFAVAVMVSCLFVSNLAALACTAALIAAAIGAARVPAGRLLAQIRPITFFLVLTSVVSLFFIRTGKPVLTLGAIMISVDGISAAVLYTMRLLFLLIAGSLLMLTTQPMVLADAAEGLFGPLQRFGIPVSQVTLILSIALRMVPTVAQEAENVVAAQTARGADLENKGVLAYARASVPVLVPLFASALRHAENLGRAMDARCYRSGANRTHFHVMRFDPRLDGIAVAVLAIYLIALTAINVLA